MSNPSSSEASGPAPIEAIDRALMLLISLSEAGPDGVPLANLGRDLGLNKSTAYRALSTMRARGFVTQDTDGSYRLGPAAIGLGADYFGPASLTQLLHPALIVLAREVDELVHLGILNGDRVDTTSTRSSPTKPSASGRRSDATPPPRLPHSDAQSWPTGRFPMIISTPMPHRRPPPRNCATPSPRPGSAAMPPRSRRTNWAPLPARFQHGVAGDVQAGVDAQHAIDGGVRHGSRVLVSRPLASSFLPCDLPARFSCGSRHRGCGRRWRSRVWRASARRSITSSISWPTNSHSHPRRQGWGPGDRRGPATG